jgi:hypothetical protein
LPPSISFLTRFLESDIVRDGKIGALYVFLDAISIIATLVEPSVPFWPINRLSRRGPGDMRRADFSSPGSNPRSSTARGWARRRTVRSVTDNGYCNRRGNGRRVGIATEWHRDIRDGVGHAKNACQAKSSAQRYKSSRQCWPPTHWLTASAFVHRTASAWSATDHRAILFSSNLSLEEVRELALSRSADPPKAFGEACRVELTSMRAAV